MVGARSVAMTMNRIIDVRYDRENPRTSNRALATGALSVASPGLSPLAAAAVLVIAAWQLNPLALKLSPVALAVLFFYSYTKRFTIVSHLVLGFCLGMSPAAAWIAIAGSLDARMLILCAAVTLWVGGFDVLYACQDVDFDKPAGPLFRPETLRHRARAGYRARDAHRHGRAAGLARVELRVCRGLPGWESPSSQACSPTSIRWSAPRSCAG